MRSGMNKYRSSLLVYSFEADGVYRVIKTNLVHYIRPEPHPARLLDFHDIFYLVDGHWSVVFENEEFSLTAGDIILLPARLRHYGRQFCRKNTRLYYIHFKMEQTDHLFSNLNEDVNHRLLVQIHTHDNGSLVRYFQDIFRFFHSNGYYKERRCSAILYLLLSELNDVSNQKRQKHDQLILEVINFLAEWPQKFFTIQKLSDKWNISPKTLTSRFRRETKISLHKYQINKKLEQISSILETSSFNSLKNLANNFGFYDEFHLSAAFKKKFGVSPSQYKKIK
jgi:AraC-like DNA-binding protein